MMEEPSSLATVTLEIGEQCVCDSCASKIILLARRLKGVETVTIDKDKNRLTVIGEVDPLQIQDDLRQKIRKKVDIVSAQPTRANANTSSGKKSDEEIMDTVSQPKNEIAVSNNEDDKKSNHKKPETDNKPQEGFLTTTVLLKLGHYCQGCRLKIDKIVSDTTGVQELAVDEKKEMITIKGAMDVKSLIQNLREGLNSPINIVSHIDEEYNNGNGKESKNVSNEAEEKRGGGQNKGSDETEMLQSKMDLEPQQAPMTVAVFKMSLHCECDGCINKIRKIVSRIRGVRDVRINREQETVTVVGTLDVTTLILTMRRRLYKLVEVQKIKMKEEAEVIKVSSQYLFGKKASKQESSSRPVLRLSVEQSETIISLPCISEGIRSQSHSPTSTGDVHTRLDSKIVGETVGWAFLILNLILEGISAVLDQQGYLLASTVLAFVALLVSVIELFDMARREGLIAFDRGSDLPCFYCHRTKKSPTSEHFSVVHCFGLTCALWQCLHSTFQYIYALRHLDNPIKMTLLPFIFLLCVLISKLVRKLEGNNCRNLSSASAKTKSQSSHNELRDASLSPAEIVIGDRGQENGSGRWIQVNDQTLESMENKACSETAVEPVDTSVQPFDFGSGDFGCKHYRRRCKIRAPCCSEIFSCWSCHDEAKNTKETSRPDCHHVPFNAVIKVICALCQTEQDVQQYCNDCGVCMGKYFCSKCKTFDDDVSKNQYHCDECGVCRNGGRCTECGKEEINQQS